MTQQLIEEYIAYFATKGQTITPEAAEGSIAMWQEGKGEMLAELVQGKPEWKDVVELYYSANSLPVPESFSMPFIKVPKMTE